MERQSHPRKAGGLLSPRSDLTLVGTERSANRTCEDQTAGRLRGERNTGRYDADRGPPPAVTHAPPGPVRA